MSANPNSLNLGLSPNDIATITVSLSATGVGLRNFGSFIFVGDSGVIDTQSRFRLYSGLTAVGNDFSTESPEYQAAEIFFEQLPTPTSLYIGAWARTATAATLVGGVLGATEQEITNFTGIANGGLTITINGEATPVTGINLTGVTTLAQVAAAVQAAFGGGVSVTWNQNSGFFQVQSGTTGPASTITFASAPEGGTDLSAPLGLQSTDGGYAVAGIAAESALACAQILRAMTSNWYGLEFHAATMPSDNDLVAVGAFIQAASVTSIFGATTQEPGVLSSQSTTDLAALMQAANYSRTFIQYSSSSPYAVADIAGLVSTIDFEGEDTLYNLKFMQPAGIVAETLTEEQAGTGGVLTSKNCNVVVNYNIVQASSGAAQTPMLQQGVMANGTFFDVIHGTDWLQNYVQANIINLYLTAGQQKSKIPQTDPGVNRVVANITQSLQQGVTNGLIAPGVWNGPPIGAIATGQTLSAGFYVYAPSVASQSTAARAARQTPVIQACIVLAGALNSANVLLNVMQ